MTSRGKPSKTKQSIKAPVDMILPSRGGSAPAPDIQVNEDLSSVVLVREKKYAPRKRSFTFDEQDMIQVQGAILQEKLRAEYPSPREKGIVKSQSSPRLLEIASPKPSPRVKEKEKKNEEPEEEERQEILVIEVDEQEKPVPEKPQKSGRKFNLTSGEDIISPYQMFDARKYGDSSRVEDLKSNSGGKVSAIKGAVKDAVKSLWSNEDTEKHHPAPKRTLDLGDHFKHLNSGHHFSSASGRPNSYHEDLVVQNQNSEKVTLREQNQVISNKPKLHRSISLDGIDIAQQAAIEQAIISQNQANKAPPTAVPAMSNQQRTNEILFKLSQKPSISETKEMFDELRLLASQQRQVNIEDHGAKKVGFSFYGSSMPPSHQPKYVHPTFAAPQKTSLQNVAQMMQGFGSMLGQLNQSDNHHNNDSHYPNLFGED